MLPPFIAVNIADIVRSIVVTAINSCSSEVCMMLELAQHHFVSNCEQTSSDWSSSNKTDTMVSKMLDHTGFGCQ